MTTFCKLSKSKQNQLLGSIRRLKEIHSKSYRGNIEDTVVESFNGLKYEDKKIILNSIFSMCLKTDNNKYVDECMNTEGCTTLDIIESEIRDIELYDKKKMLDLKTWLIKFILVIVTIVGSIGIFLGYHINFINGSTDIFSNTYEMFKIIIGM